MILRAMESRPIHPLLFWAMLVCLLPWNEAGGQAQNRPVAPQPPIPLRAGSPVDFFRQLITAKPEERDEMLRRRAPDSPQLRAALEQHARRYQDMPAEQRELRLRNMELRYHLTSLFRTAPTNRIERLKSVPERDRPLVEDRLKYWDSLSPEEQQEELKKELLTREIIGAGLPKMPPNPARLTGSASNQLVRIEQQLVKWQLVPEARRAKAQQYFTNLFELTDEEQAGERLLPAQLSEEERQLMERALTQFKQLSPAQRSACVLSFDKLASLSPSERRAFLVNVEEWQKMSAEDRKAWRKLVSKVPPPLPQYYRRPPLPMDLRPVRSGSTTTAQYTN
jgi:hypothetical protein